MVRLGVVGGSSLVTFDPRDSFDAIGLKVTSQKTHTVKNEFGSVSLKTVEMKGSDGADHAIIFMQRHGHSKGGITPPHKINHKANVRALADQKVDAIVATTSVGTISAAFPPGRVGVANQYIDFTGVVVTYHEDDAKFTSVTTPFDPDINAALIKTLRKVQKLKSDVMLEFTYWLSNGPYYETPAEVTAAERLGAHVCGMTAVREAKLCRELDIPYSCLTIASNWAAGRHPGDPTMALSHEEVSEMSARVTSTVVTCLVDIFKNGLPSAGDKSAPPTPSKNSAHATKKQKVR